MSLSVTDSETVPHIIFTVVKNEVRCHSVDITVDEETEIIKFSADIDDASERSQQCTCGNCSQIFASETNIAGLAALIQLYQQILTRSGVPATARFKTSLVKGLRHRRTSGAPPATPVSGARTPH
jgi:hypothetical protein